MQIPIRRDQRNDILRRVDLLSGCTPAELRRIAALLTEIDVDAGTVLTQEGKQGAEFFIILEGYASVVRNNVLLATLGPLQFFGELALLDGGVRTATVVATTDLHLFVLSRTEFKKLWQSFPSVSARMLHALATRIRRVDELLLPGDHGDTCSPLTAVDGVLSLESDDDLSQGPLMQTLIEQESTEPDKPVGHAVVARE
jgi:CRP/FNR family transcriptional regulator, cyclic AMP receptor protein